MPLHAQVVPLTPVAQRYTYAVPDDLDAEAVPGARVLVPFGNRTLTGVVTARRADAPPGVALKPLLDVLDVAPVLTPALLQLTQWIARYYACSWGEVVRAALPAGLAVEGRRVLTRTERPLAAYAGPPAAQALLAWLDTRPDGVVLKNVQRAYGQAVPPALWRALRREGFVAVAEVVEEAKVRVKTERWLRLGDRVDAAAVRGAKQQALLAVVQAAGAEGLRQADALAQAGASSATAQALLAKGWLREEQREVLRSALPEPITPPPHHTLHAGQVEALRALTVAVEAGDARTFLLHGVTGSGKTEVYLQALKQTLALGKTGIVLVPEIALTPQTVRRFRAHFGDRVAVLHSRMSDGERYDAWRQLRAGRLQIAIGPRSAILAPLDNVGLIVVDEEHEPSYKQFDPAPRYHARDVAVMRAHLAGAVCVLGSATPSAETWHNAQTGKYLYLPMPERVPVAGKAAAPLPPVRVVNLAYEQEVRRLKGALSDDLRAAIQARLDRREQVILLQNRRGYAPVLTCQQCGWTPQCPRCDVSLTYHKPQHHDRCHYCGYTERPPVECPKCGSYDFAYVGAGTQRVEEELAAVFPTARLLRMDLDTTRQKDGHAKILRAFGAGEADLLLGTQMVAKGLDFPRVTLVGVVNADVGMLLPDFRAAERTFQLLAQVGGRAGRAEHPGEVILQTRNPDHPAIQFALHHDYEGFIQHELPERRLFGYPPYGRLVGIEFKGPDEARLADLARTWTDALRAATHADDPRMLSLGDGAPLVPQHLQVLGPTPAFIGRIKRQFRLHTVLKAPLHTNPYTLTDALDAVQQIVPVPTGYRVNVDVDPLGLF